MSYYSSATPSLVTLCNHAPLAVSGSEIPASPPANLLNLSGSLTGPGSGQVRDGGYSATNNISGGPTNGDRHQDPYY